jgi:hypothetical protein
MKSFVFLVLVACLFISTDAAPIICGHTGVATTLEEYTLRGPKVPLNAMISAKATAAEERVTCRECRDKIIELGKIKPICQVTCTNLCSGTGDRAIFDLSSFVSKTTPEYVQCQHNSPPGAQCVCSILMSSIAQGSNDALAQQLGAQITSVCQCPGNVYDQATTSTNPGAPPGAL